MDSVAFVSSVATLRASASAQDRVLTVAANAARMERQTVAVLLQTLQRSSYGADGRASAAPPPGGRLSARA